MDVPTGARTTSIAEDTMASPFSFIGEPWAEFRASKASEKLATIANVFTIVGVSIGVIVTQVVLRVRGTTSMCLKCSSC